MCTYLTAVNFSCMTVHEFFNHTTESNIMLLFSSGIHNLTRNVTFENKLDVTITSYTTQENQTHIILHQSDIVIQNSAKFTLSYLSITSFSTHLILLNTVMEVAIENVIITGNAIIIQCLSCNAVKVSNVIF